jgi:hypothetical protein
MVPGNIVSVHLADVGRRRALQALARPPRAGAVPGLSYGVTTLAAPLSPRLLPVPVAGRVALVASWRADEDLDRFLAADRLGRLLRDGFHARMHAVHVFGSFSPLAGVLGDQPAMEDDEPAAVLTIGRLRLAQTIRFLRASAAAEELAGDSPALLAASGLARPPRLVATFSLWRSKAGMRAYAGGGEGAGHKDAVRAHAARPFHHESAFIRLRPYRVEGRWDGHEPLPAAALAFATVR